MDALELFNALDDATGTIVALIQDLALAGKPELADMYRPYLAAYQEILASQAGSG